VVRVTRYTVTAYTDDGTIVWSADFDDRIMAADLYNSAVFDPTPPVRRVVLSRDDRILTESERFDE
jgi:hypothetical protein